MLIRPDRDDLRVVGYYLAKVLLGLSIVQAAPLVVALAIWDVNSMTALAIGTFVTVSLGLLGEHRFETRDRLEWSHGLVTVALAWLLGPALLAIPFYLSGHFGGYVDAYFDAMSGLTTSGLSVVQDLDHLSLPMNLYRHATHFAGGQGIIIVVLTLFAASAASLPSLYVGEGRDDRILPNIVQTSRFIFRIAIVYMVVGWTALYIAGMVAGLSPGRAATHGISLFMAAFDTGGFSPMSQSMAYYHSAGMESVIIVLMVAGTISFGMHYGLWHRQQREVVASLEARTFAITLTIGMAIAVLGLARAATFDGPGALFRKGVFTIVSAHTGTGFAVNQARLFVTDWGLIAPAAIVLTMGLGGMANSTAGGIKAIRIGIAAKSVARDVRKAVQPDSAIALATYRSRTRRLVISDDVVAKATTIIILFLLLYLGGAVAGVAYGYPLNEALFESVSAAASVGLTSGITAPDMPLFLKLVYIVQMWLGRLEFMAVFALVGYGVALVRGRT